MRKPEGQEGQSGIVPEGKGDARVEKGGSIKNIVALLEDPYLVEMESGLNEQEYRRMGKKIPRESIPVVTARQLRESAIVLLKNEILRVNEKGLQDPFKEFLPKYFDLHTVGVTETEIRGFREAPPPFPPRNLSVFVDLAIAYYALARGAREKKKSEDLLRRCFFEIEEQVLPGRRYPPNDNNGVRGFELLIRIAEKIHQYLPSVDVAAIRAATEEMIRNRVTRSFKNFCDPSNDDIAINPLEHPPGRSLPISPEDPIAAIEKSAKTHTIELPLNDLRLAIEREASAVDPLIVATKSVIEDVAQFGKVYEDLREKVKRLDTLCVRAERFPELTIDKEGLPIRPKEYLAEINGMVHAVEQEFVKVFLQEKTRDMLSVVMHRFGERIRKEDPLEAKRLAVQEMNELVSVIQQELSEHSLQPLERTITDAMWKEFDQKIRERGAHVLHGYLRESPFHVVDKLKTIGKHFAVIKSAVGKENFTQVCSVEEQSIDAILQDVRENIKALHEALSHDLFSEYQKQDIRSIMKKITMSEVVDFDHIERHEEYFADEIRNLKQRDADTKKQ